ARLGFRCRRSRHCLVAASRRTVVTAALLDEAALALGRGEHNDAARQLRRALVIDPMHIAAGNAFAAMLILATSLVRAEGTLARALAISPEEPSLWINRAVRALRAKEPAPAARCSRIALALMPQAKQAFIHLGWAMQEACRPAALAAFRHALDLDAES